MPIRSKQNRLEKTRVDDAPSGPAPKDPKTAATKLLAGLMRGQITFGSMLGFEADDLQRLLEMGQARMSMGKYKQARRIFEGVTALEPGIAAFYVPLGLACEAEGDLDAAFDSYTEAIHLMSGSDDPMQCGAYFGRSQVRVLQGDLAGALTDVALAREYDDEIDDKLRNTIDTLSERWAERFAAERIS